jgi:hypothetical protein
MATLLNHGFEFLCQVKFIMASPYGQGGLLQQLWTEEKIYSILKNSSYKNSACHGWDFCFLVCSFCYQNV